MLRSSSKTKRVIGGLLILGATAAALPLTAGHAIAYVDVPAPAASITPAPQVVPATTAVAATAVQAAPAPAPAAQPLSVGRRAETYRDSDADGDMTINEEFVRIDGKSKRWEELTPAEFARVRAAVAKARASLANTHIDQAKLMRDIANIPDQARIQQIQQNLAATRSRLSESVSRIDAEAAAARAAGREPDRLEAAVRERLAAARDMDVEAAARALASIDRQKISAQVAGAQQSVEKAKAELARIQARIDADPRN